MSWQADLVEGALKYSGSVFSYQRATVAPHPVRAGDERHKSLASRVQIYTLHIGRERASDTGECDKACS
jgi:hypothetical protein